MKKTLSFKQYLKKYYGYKNANDLYAHAINKKLSKGTMLLIKESIEESYLAYCNEKHKKYNPLWY